MFGYRESQPPVEARATARASTIANHAAHEVRGIEDRFERLSLVCMAMWSLLQDKTNLTEQELLDRVQMIDLMDGTADSKAGKTGVVKCGSCDRPMSTRHMRCIYCGADRPAGSAFDTL
jgi:hypothetical protein